MKTGISKFICESFLCEFCGLRCDAQNFRVNVPIHKDLFLAIITILIQVTNVLSTRILIQYIIHTHPNVLMHFPLKFLWSHICQRWCVCVHAWTYYMYIYISVHCTHTHTVGRRQLTNSMLAVSVWPDYQPPGSVCLELGFSQTTSFNGHRTLHSTL